MKRFMIGVCILMTGITFLPALVSTTESSDLDLSRLHGKWYEIARLPNPYQNNITQSTTTYTFLRDGRIEILNEGKRNGEKRSIKGNGRIPDQKYPNRWKVAFFLFFESDYLIIDHDRKAYSYLVVSGGTLDSYWIFSRTPALDAAVFDRLIKQAEKLGFQTEKLIKAY